jgi:hypothetical protein
VTDDSVPLRDYVELRWSDHESVHQSEALARQRALDSMDQRLDAMNEFRASLNDVVNQSVPREMYDQRHAELDRRIQEVERNMVRQGALDAANSELARTRKALAYTILGGVVITLIAAVVDVVIRASGH